MKSEQIIHSVNYFSGKIRLLRAGEVKIDENISNSRAS